jgi:hypothetical protein
MSEYNPSGYQIDLADVITEDGRRESIANLITGCEIGQSIDSMSYMGALRIHDTIGLLDGLPFRGEEHLDLTIVPLDTNEPIKLEAQVYKISDVGTTEGLNGVIYLIHFVSRVTYEASKRLITASYKDNISTIAREVFDKYFNKLSAEEFTDLEGRSLEYFSSRSRLLNSKPERYFYKQPCIGTTKIIIPRYTPANAIRFLSTHGYGLAPSQTYRFFETLYDYYFVTDEWLIKEGVAKSKNNKIKSFYYSPYSTIDPEDPEAQFQRIENISIASRSSDTQEDLLSGSYVNNVSTIDFINRNYKEKTFRFSDTAFINMEGQIASSRPDEHTDSFISKTFTEENARRFMVIKDFGGFDADPQSLRSDDKIKDLVSNRVFYDTHLKGTSIGASLKGRMDITPGEIINLNVKAFDSVSDAEDSKTISGKYLVQSCRFALENDVIHTNMRLVRMGWSE